MPDRYNNIRVVMITVMVVLLACAAVLALNGDKGPPIQHYSRYPIHTSCNTAPPLITSCIREQ